MDLSERLKEIRKVKNLSQSAFGERLGVSRDVINNAENGRAVPNDLFLRHLCTVYHVNPEWLYTGDGERFIINEDSIISELCETHPLDELDIAIIKNYINLEPFQRKVIKDYVKSLVKIVESEDVKTFKISAVGGQKDVELSKEQRSELGQLEKALEVKDDAEDLT